ncbi:MAG: DUF4331 domain-containing protein [Myxococcota bacterium]|nr:DUF4331 domain-containing protein [Myxococcota bacterium]
MRTSKMLTSGATLIAALALVACGDDPVTPVDSGMRDSGMVADSGMADSGMTDSGMTDGGTTDGGMVAMARGRDNPPTIGDQIDRVGRPAISTATVGTFLPDAMRAARRDAYSDATDPSMWDESFTGDIAASLGVLDSLDTVCGNQLLAGDAAVDGRYDALAGVLANDRLWVDAASGVNAGNLYLGVEAEALGVLEEGGAGGRRPTDDVIERSYSVLAAGALAGIDDTITMDEGGATNATFPFLGAPE